MTESKFDFSVDGNDQKEAGFKNSASSTNENGHDPERTFSFLPSLAEYRWVAQQQVRGIQLFWKALTSHEAAISKKSDAVPHIRQTNVEKDILR